MLIPFKTLKEKYGINPTGVLHIGASTGQELPDYYSNGIQRSVWIEADENTFIDLSINCLKYNNAKPINACISDKDGQLVSFNISNNEGQSSSIFEFGTHAQVHPEVKFVGSRTLRTDRVDNLLTKHKLHIEDYTFLNIDLQGAELLALKGMGELLNKVQYAYIEVNKAELYKGCPLVEEIAEYMIFFGFELKDVVWAGNTNWGDAFFMRENKA